MEQRQLRVVNKAPVLGPGVNFRLLALFGQKPQSILSFEFDDLRKADFSCGCGEPSEFVSLSSSLQTEH